jgi:NADPH:quinone reductase-like Zn-dependent oxidoreductase
MSMAVRFSEYGTSEVLGVVDVPAPAPGPGQVRLAVHAAGVNPIDWKIMQGLMSQMIPLDLPAGLGSDVAGVVDQVGEGVTAFVVGDEVLGGSVTPAYASAAVADAAALVTKPTTVPWEVAGTLAGAGGTAWTVLDRLGISKGETLLIHAAAGGVGTFAVQLAVARGVRVIGTASEHNHEQLRWLGTVPVTYGEGLVDRVRAVAPEGVDAVLDASGRGEIPHRGGAAAGSDLAYLPLMEAGAALDSSRAGHVGGKIVLLPA